MARTLQSPATRTVEVQFPLAGLDRGASFQSQPPYTTPDALNVVPAGAPEMRRRGGPRPGFILDEHNLLHQPNSYGALYPVQCIGLLPRYGLWQSLWDEFEDPFTGKAIGRGWVGGYYTEPPATRFVEGFVEARNGEHYGSVTLALADYDEDESHSVSIWVYPYKGAYGGSVCLYLTVNCTTKNYRDNGVEFELDLSVPTKYRFWIRRYVNGAVDSFHDSGQQNLSSLDPGYTAPCPREFRVDLIRRSSGIGDTFECFWRRNTLYNEMEVTPIGGDPLYRMVGYSIHGTSADTTARVRVRRFRHRGKCPTNPAITPLATTHVYFVQLGYLYTEHPDGRLGPYPVDTAIQFLSDRRLASVTIGNCAILAAGDGLQIANFADGHGTSVGGCGYKIATNNPEVMQADKNIHVISITSAGENPAGTYGIDHVTFEEGRYQVYVLCSYKYTADCICAYITRADMRYIPDGDTPRLCPFVPLPEFDASGVTVGNRGLLPTGCRLICHYAGRLVHGRSMERPHGWWMSRVGSPWDHLPSIDIQDQDQPRGGTTGQAGIPPQPLMALVPWTNDYLLMATQTAILRLSGDPGYGGRFDVVSRTTGIIGMSAWCHLPDGTLVFLARDGLYSLNPGAIGIPQPMSPNKLPDELQDCAAFGDDVVLAYEYTRRAILIGVTPIMATRRNSWWFDLDTLSFWPVEFQADHIPTAVGNDERGNLLIGCRDGKLRRFDQRSEVDDAGVAITNYVVIGPLRAGFNLAGILVEMTAVTSASGGPVAWQLYTGDTAEEALASTAIGSGTWSRSGLQYTDWPQMRFGSFYLKLSPGTVGRRWAFESAALRMNAAGILRVLA